MVVSSKFRNLKFIKMNMLSILLLVAIAVFAFLAIKKNSIGSRISNWFKDLFGSGSSPSGGGVHIQPPDPINFIPTVFPGVPRNCIQEAKTACAGHSIFTRPVCEAQYLAHCLTH
jgi:hypothetical protein